MLKSNSYYIFFSNKKDIENADYKSIYKRNKLFFFVKPLLKVFTYGEYHFRGL